MLHTIGPIADVAKCCIDAAARIHEYHAQGAALVDGYAPFCKHVFVPNFVRAKAGAMPVCAPALTHADLRGLFVSTDAAARWPALAYS